MPAPVSPGENRLRRKRRKWPHGMRLTKHGLIDSDRPLIYPYHKVLLYKVYGIRVN